MYCKRKIVVSISFFCLLTPKSVKREVFEEVSKEREREFGVSNNWKYYVFEDLLIDVFKSIKSEKFICKVKREIDVDVLLFKFIIVNFCSTT